MLWIEYPTQLVFLQHNGFKLYLTLLLISSPQTALATSFQVSHWTNDSDHIFQIDRPLSSQLEELQKEDFTSFQPYSHDNIGQEADREIEAPPVHSTSHLFFQLRFVKYPCKETHFVAIVVLTKIFVLGLQTLFAMEYSQYKNLQQMFLVVFSYYANVDLFLCSFFPGIKRNNNVNYTDHVYCRQCRSTISVGT